MISIRCFCIILLLIEGAYAQSPNEPMRGDGVPEWNYVWKNFTISNVKEVINLNTSEFKVVDRKGEFSSFTGELKIVNIIVDLYKEDEYYFSAVGRTNQVSEYMIELIEEAEKGDIFLFNTIKLEDSRGKLYSIQEIAINY